MTASRNQQDNAVGGLARHTIYQGLATLAVAVVHFIFLRGVSVGVLLLFVVPPLAALLLMHRAATKGERRLAVAFLLLVAFGAVVAPFQAILPNLGGIDQHLPAKSDRLLAWYAAVYTLFIPGILPTYFLAGNLRRDWRGEPAAISRFICYLALPLLALVWPGLLVLVGALLGLWPFPD